MSVLKGVCMLIKRSVSLDQETNHLIGCAIGDVEELTGWIAGNRIRSHADGISTNRGESATRAHLKRGDGGVIFVDCVNEVAAGQHIDGCGIISHREEGIGAIRDRRAQAARGAQLPVVH